MKDFRILTKEQKDLLEAQCNPKTLTGCRNIAIIAFLRSTGCRVSELTSLCHNKIDLKTSEVQLFGKGEKKRRVGVDLASMRKILLWVEKKVEKFGKSKGEDPFFCAVRSGVFGSAKCAPGKSAAGSKLSRQSVFKMLQSKGRLAGVAGGIGREIFPHLFRHSRACECVENMSLKNVQDMLGHENITTTTKYLRGLNPQLMIDKMKSLPS